MELTTRYGVGWMPFALSTEGLSHRLEQLTKYLDSYNHSLAELEIIPSLLFQLGKNKAAVQQLLPKWGKPSHISRAIVGNPSECIDRITDYAESGATHLALRLLIPDKAE